MNEYTENDWIDMLADEKQTHESILEEKNQLDYRRNFLNNALTILNKREKEIFSARKLFDQPKKLEELSKKYNVSRERIRQIEEKALDKVKKYIKINQKNN